ncbi:MAG TPA: PH domain-containing protein [Candidatus Bathyarchaeia archaeon]|nr:PH domain-containing protein [Candidatus Bathyarchaeia archaeon]
MFGEIRFPGQHDDEQVVLFLRRHWYIFFIHLLSVLAAILGLVLAYVFFTLFGGDFSQSAYHNLLLFAESLGMLFVWNLFFILWLDFYLDAWIVTNERIVNIDQKGFFNRDISELKLTKIQDVTSEIIGVIPTVLGYGNIYVQTAAEVERFTFHQIPNPNEVKNIIVQLQEKERKNEEVEMGQAIRGEL